MTGKQAGSKNVLLNCWRLLVNQFPSSIEERGCLVLYTEYVYVNQAVHTEYLVEELERGIVVSCDSRNGRLGTRLGSFKVTVTYSGTSAGNRMPRQRERVRFSPTFSHDAFVGLKFDIGTLGVFSGLGVCCVLDDRHHHD